MKLYDIRVGDATPKSPAKNILIPVFRNPHFKAYPRHADGGRASYLPPRIAFNRHYSTDAHFAQYCVPAIRRRLAGEAPEAIIGGVPMVLRAYDVDAPKKMATNEWRAKEREKIEACFSTWPCSWYWTRGGYHLVWINEEAFIISGRDDAERWKRYYVAGAIRLRKWFGIEADLKCSDWPRLIRLPHATRED